MYFIPLIFAFLLSAGGIGIFMAKIPADQIKITFIQVAVKYAQNMFELHGKKTNQNPMNESKNTKELIKMESRRRKNDWKDISDEYAWTWRHMEEGDGHNPNYGRYKLVVPERVWCYNKDYSGDSIHYDTNFYIRTEFHHWVMYFGTLIGLVTFFNGFISEIQKALL